MREREKKIYIEKKERNKRAALALSLLVTSLSSHTPILHVSFSLFFLFQLLCKFLHHVAGAQMLVKQPYRAVTALIAIIALLFSLSERSKARRSLLLEVSSCLLLLLLLV